MLISLAVCTDNSAVERFGAGFLIIRVTTFTPYRNENAVPWALFEKDVIVKSLYCD